MTTSCLHPSMADEILMRSAHGAWAKQAQAPRLAVDGSTGRKWE